MTDGPILAWHWLAADRRLGHGDGRKEPTDEP